MVNESNVCPGCGVRQAFQGRFCGNCGRDLSSADVFSESLSEQDLVEAAVVTQKFFRGREQELARVPELAREALNRRGCVWWLSGPAGIGKTAFISQIVPFLAKNNFLVVRMEASPDFTHLTYYPFQQVVNKLIGITEQTDKPQLADLLKKLDAYGLSRIDQFYLRHLYPVELPATASHRLEDSVRLTAFAAAIVHLVQKMADTRPLVLVIDQFEHADPFTQRLVGTLQLIAPQERLFVIVADRNPPVLAAGPTGLVHTPFEPMSLADIIAIVRMYTKAARLPVEVEEQLHDSVEGVPLAAFLLADYLQEKDYLVSRNQQFRVNEKYRGMAFPRGLDAILSARLGLMRPHIQELLWLIAVGGPECTVQMLRSIYSYPEFLKVDLEELAQKHLVRIGGEARAHRVAFTHNLIRDYIYTRIPSSGLATLHPKVSTYIRLQEPLQRYMKVWLAIIHMTHQNERSELAVNALERAGDSLVAHLHFLLAIQCYRRESHLLREMAREPHRDVTIYERKLMIVLMKLARAYRAVGDVEHAQKTYRLVSSMAAGLDAPFTKIEALSELADFLLKHNLGETCKSCLDEALIEAKKSGDAAVISQVLWKLGEWYRRMGPPVEALDVLAEAERLAEPLDAEIQPSNRWLAAVQLASGLVRMDQKQEGEALERLVAAMDRSISARNIPLMIRAIERLAVYYGQRGEHETGLGFIKLGLRVARDVGDRLSLANLSYQAGRFLMNSRKRAEAEIAFFDTLQLCREINWQQGMEMSRLALNRLKDGQP